MQIYLFALAWAGLILGRKLLEISSMKNIRVQFSNSLLKSYQKSSLNFGYEILKLTPPVHLHVKDDFMHLAS